MLGEACCDEFFPELITEACAKGDFLSPPAPPPCVSLFPHDSVQSHDRN